MTCMRQYIEIPLVHTTKMHLCMPLSECVVFALHGGHAQRACTDILDACVAKADRATWQQDVVRRFPQTLQSDHLGGLGLESTT